MNANLLEPSYQALQRGDWRAALDFAERILVDGDGAAVRHAIGLAHCGAGNLEDALAALRAACQLEPGVARWARDAAAVLARLDRWADVFETLGPGLVDHDESALALYLHAAVAIGAAGVAVAAVDGRKTALTNGSPVAVQAYASALAAAGDPGGALAVAQAGLSRADDDPALHDVAARALEGLGRPAEAVVHWQRHAQLHPGSAFAQMRLALALLDRGQCDASRAARQAAGQVGAMRPEDRSSGLYLMLSDPDVTPAEFLAAARLAFASAAATATSPAGSAGRITATPRRRSARDRIRVGYLSAEFRSTPSFYFTTSFLQAHDRAAVEVILYNTSPADDGATAAYRQLAERWRRVADVSAEAFQQIVRADDLDVLVDLSGHWPHNRLQLLAERLAPVQAYYPHFPGTTGCPGIDYFISDRFTSPAGCESDYAETLWRLDGGYLAFGEPDEAPPLAPPGFPRFTFGVFQRLAKFTPAVFDVLARVLHAAPESQLLLQNGDPELDRPEGPTSQWIAAQFRDRGIDAGRVELRGPLGRAEHLGMAGAVDVALDTFPYGGQTTTCESLWMGVPVVTMLGRTHAGRVCAGLLTRVGRPDWIASTPDQYVDIAAGLARAPRSDVAARRAIRESFVSSGLTDGRSVASALERAYERWSRA